jgi:hypothetical protein
LDYELLQKLTELRAIHLSDVGLLPALSDELAHAEHAIPVAMKCLR